MRGVDIGDKRRPVCRLIAAVSKRLNKTGEGDDDPSIIARGVRLNDMKLDYESEFPDYPAGTIPSIPRDWRDISWHNDTCPCWLTPNNLTVYIDYPDHADREFGGMISRFTVLDDYKDLLSTDNWLEVITIVASTVRPG